MFQLLAEGKFAIFIIISAKNDWNIGNFYWNYVNCTKRMYVNWLKKYKTSSNLNTTYNQNMTSRPFTFHTHAPFDIWFLTILSDRMTAHFLTEKKKKENGILYASRFNTYKFLKLFPMLLSLSLSL